MDIVKLVEDFVHFIKALCFKFNKPAIIVNANFGVDPLDIFSPSFQDVFVWYLINLPMNEHCNLMPTQYCPKFKQPAITIYFIGILNK